jgi:CheY-like chemotaxis protein
MADSTAPSPDAAVTAEDAATDAAAVASFLSRLRESMDLSITKTVLVVEDAAMMRRLACDFITKAAPLIKVVEAENGQDALGKLAWIRHTTKRDPVLIITDLEMPGMDGWQLIEELQKDYLSRGQSQGIPLIVLSSTDGEKGFFIGKRTIKKGRCTYSPMVAVAKSTCINPRHYDSIGDKGLVSWIEYFLRSA